MTFVNHTSSNLSHGWLSQLHNCSGQPRSVTPNRVVHSQLVDLRAVFEDSREVPEVPAGELDVPGGQAVADVGGVQGVRLLTLHLPEMKSLFDGYSWQLLVLL